MDAKVEIITNCAPDRYNKLATHPLQSWEWGQFRKAQGYKVIRLGKYSGNTLKEIFQVTFHPIPLIPLTVGYLPKSSLPTKEVIEKLKQVGKENKAIFIKLEPNVENSESAIGNLQFDSFVQGKSLFTKYTSSIDLTKSEEELLKNFKPKTRYNIRLAEGHGVIVREDNSDSAFENYLKLLFETTSRQGFYAHDEKYHRLQWQILKSSGISHLLSATYQGKTLATFLLFVFNNVLYYPYGASTREHKELMAPTLLIWEAIKLGKRLGCKSFDLWGDIELNPSPANPYYGFHRFKEGFSPKLVEFVGSYDLVINPALYRIYQIVDKIRWKTLKLKSRLK